MFLVRAQCCLNYHSNDKLLKPLAQPVAVRSESIVAKTAHGLTDRQQSTCYVIDYTIKDALALSELTAEKTNTSHERFPPLLAIFHNWLTVSVQSCWEFTLCKCQCMI